MLEVKKNSSIHFLVGNQAFLLEIRLIREFKDTIITLSSHLLRLLKVYDFGK